MSFFKQHVLYFRLKNVAGLACQRFVRSCIVKDFDSGAVVCRQDDNCDFFYVLIDGQMTITQRSGHVDKVLGTIKSGAAFGEYGIIRQTRRTATITAASKCSAMIIDKNSFLEILHLSNPEMVLKKTSFLLKALPAPLWSTSAT
jgi:CRP-like cAMP-binding protein